MLGTPHWPGALTFANGRFAFGGPTHKQAKRIAWKDLKDFTYPFWRCKPSESELVIQLVTGSEIHVIGLDEPARIEGTIWHGLVLDEFPNMKAGLWSEHVQPLTADFNAWVDMLGVPDFRGTNAKEYKERFDAAMMRLDPAWGAFTWKSADVLSADVIAQAMRDLSPALFRQEYEASFETAPGRAYSEFAKTLHVTETPYMPTLPVLVSCDFNSGHHNWGMYQFDGKMYRAFDEVYLQSATVEGMTTALKDKCRSYGIPEASVQFFGDYSGTAHKAEATWSAWEQIKAAFPGDGRYHYRVQGPIADRINLVNAYLRNAAGEVRTQIDPRCRQLINDLEYVTTALLFGGAKSAELSHASDNFGYLLVQHSSKKVISDTERQQIASRFRL